MPGYFDAYLGFVAAPGVAPHGARRIVDVGAGTAALAEAWVAVHGTAADLTLLDPSAGMLARGQTALTARGAHATCVQGLLGSKLDGPFDEVLAAHVIEHCPDPGEALAQMAALLRPGGRLRLIVSKPHWCNVIIWLQWRHRTFGAAEICALIEAAGLEVEMTYAFPVGPPSRTSRGLVARKPG